jgi:PDZ domain-containing protein
MWSSLALAGLLPCAVVLFVLWLVPSDQFLLLPDTPHLAASVVNVQGGKPNKGPGSLYFVDVRERRASRLEVDFPGLAPDGATFIPAAELLGPGVSESQNQQLSLQEMARSQQIAAAVALKQLGYKVNISSTGALVVEVAEGAPAQGKLEPGDVIVSVDGQRVETQQQARELLRRHKPGDVVQLGLRNSQGLRTVAVKTIADPSDPKVPLIGVLLEQAAQIKLPVHVTIDTGDIGGPSAGLPFALEVMQKLGKDVTRGYRVAATGEMFLDGAVGPIGGVKQKTLGARAAGVDIFLVPAGDNAQTARRYAGRMRIVPVESFRQALHALATLPPKR